MGMAGYWVYKGLNWTQEDSWVWNQQYITNKMGMDMYSTNLMMWNGQFICKYDQIWHANDNINLTDRCLLPTLCGNCHQCMDIHVGQCCKTNVSFISCQMPTSKIARCVPKCKSKSLDLMMRFKLTIANTYTLLCWHFGRLQSTTSFSPKSP